MVATIALPALIRIGGGALAELPDVLKKLGIGRPLVVTDPWFVQSGVLERCTGLLKKAGVPHDVFSGVVCEPTDTSIEAGVAALKKDGYDGLVGFGGGSSIDTAKAMSLMHRDGGKMRDYKVPRQNDAHGIPVVGVPTTAGTGSEVTKFCVVTDTETEEKMVITGLAVVPRGAVVDFELTFTKPFRLSADTGVDTLTHAIEAYVSKRANPVCDLVAISAMKRVAKYLRAACQEPQNREAREQMMLAAHEAGIAFSNASVALVHGMSRPIGAFFHVPHGLSNAMLLPLVTEFSVNNSIKRYADCARAMGAAGDEEGDQSAARKLVEALRRLNADLKVPSPKDYGIDARKFAGVMRTMALQAISSGSPNNNPRVPSEDEIVALYERAYA